MADALGQAAGQVVASVDLALPAVGGDVLRRVVGVVLGRLAHAADRGDLAPCVVLVREAVGIGFDLGELAGGGVTVVLAGELLQRLHRVRLQGVERGARAGGLAQQAADGVVAALRDEVARLAAGFAAQAVALDGQCADLRERAQRVVPIAGRAVRCIALGALAQRVVEMPEQVAVLVFFDQAAVAVVAEARDVGGVTVHRRGDQVAGSVACVMRGAPAPVGFRGESAGGRRSGIPRSRPGR